ncbi:hypothetical protein FQK07_05640 [Synechococcus sp. BSF8S]|uniref:hypothetical protein n=1 Tax=Synechococcales TaxID=1890424 RepID=UPI0016231D7E|nr:MULTISPECIES: hypothetical protein [unclassified Synechococcus]MBC1260759.1 hypothetical protein [Synechococcus sp. BSF8S]MBC1263409.1 hypothetical protein [Synechococcus sp. BSA11S]
MRSSLLAAACLLGLSTAIANLEGSEQKLEQLGTKAFQDQLKAFRSEVSRVASNKNTTLEEAAAELKDKAQPVLAAGDELSRSVECEVPEQPCGRWVCASATRATSTLCALALPRAD